MNKQRLSLQRSCYTENNFDSPLEEADHCQGRTAGLTHPSLRHDSISSGRASDVNSVMSSSTLSAIHSPISFPSPPDANLLLEPLPNQAPARMPSTDTGGPSKLPSLLGTSHRAHNRCLSTDAELTPWCGQSWTEDLVEIALRGAFVNADTEWTLLPSDFRNDVEHVL